MCTCLFITFLHRNTLFLLFQVDQLWLGGSDLETENTWKWVTGEAVDMRHSSEGGKWSAGEPNDNYGQDCMVINWRKDKWDDQDCGWTKKFACEVKRCPAANDVSSYQAD